MGKIEDKRAFRRFVGETVKEYILEVVKGRTDKSHWKNVFDSVRRKHYDNMAMTKYKEIMKNFPQPEEGEDMEEFIKKHFNDEQLDLYKRVKNINYTQPKGEYHKVEKPSEYYTKLANVIVEFVTNDKTPELPINPQATNINTLLTETYDAINGSSSDNLENVLKRINESVTAHRNTDERNNIKRLNREVKRVENEKMEALADKDKEHEEDKKKLQAEHYADKQATVAFEKSKTEARVRKEYEEPFNEDLIDDVNNKLIPYDENKVKVSQDIQNKLQEDALITRAATDNIFYNQLPDEIKQSLRPKIEEKKAIIERSKVIRYLLPKERPKWSNATMSKGVNPLLSRGAWGI